jgi:hypothetical protein
MTRTLANRRTAGIITAALALGIAAPAGARPFDVNSAGSYVPTGSSLTPAQGVALTPSRAGGGGIPGLGYVAIGTGGAAVALEGPDRTGAHPRPQGAGRQHSAAGDRVPVPRPAPVRSGQPRLLLRARDDRRRHPRTSCSRAFACGCRGVGQRQVLRPAGRSPRGGPRW